MPYISRDRRAQIDMGDYPRTPGEMNYTITKIIAKYLGPQARYNSYNEAIGILECAKLELYRRVVAPYEDAKRIENGDVYEPVRPL